MTNAEWMIKNNIKFYDLQIVADVKRGIYLILVDRGGDGKDLLYWNELAPNQDCTERFLESFIFDWLSEEVEDD